MDRQEIIRMAREAGLEIYHLPDSMMEYEFDRRIERFAALVAAAEREACAKLCEAEAKKWEGKDGPVCFEVRLCSDAIRARGEK